MRPPLRRQCSPRHWIRSVMANLPAILLTFSLAFFGLSAGGVLPRSTVTNDFEAGTTYPWFDNSPSDVHWVVEDVESPLEVTAAPRPVNGTKYLRAYRGASGTAFGLAVFSSPYFTALPGDNIFFNFWIRSQHTGGNSLEVYYVLNGVEERILNLGIFSSPSNFEWRSASAAIPISEPTDMRLIIYGYCGGVREDAIAIDNIIVRRPVDNTTTTTGPDTTISSSTTTTTTTAATTTIISTSTEGTTTTTEVPTPTQTDTPTSDPTTTTTPAPSGNCTFVLTAPSGQIKSPNYPNNYGPNTSCTWLIKLEDPYKKVKFDFVDFVSETCCDVLTVYDGESENSQVLLKHQGTYLPTPTSVTSTVSNVLIKFASDYAIQHTGFWIEYSGVY